MKDCLVRLFIASVFLSIAGLPISAQRDSFQTLSCIMHVHSRYSGMKNGKSLYDIVNEARAKGINVVITSDKDLLRWEYGFWPLSNLVKATYSFPSVLSIGPGKYLDDINKLEKRFPDMTVIPGVESAPFYYWKGNPLSGNLEMHGWHKHMLITGLENPGDYENLPVVSNTGAGAFNGFKLWPLLLFITAFFVRRKKTAAALTVASVILMFNYYPFRDFEFNNYSGDQGEKPYQKLIDYVNSKGGLIFWAHPEAVNAETPRKFGRVTVSTPRYAKSILDTFNYTGFAIFSEGSRETGNPGGYWDQALMQYCAGTRERPVWAVGELDYGENSLGMDQVQNILTARDGSRAAVLEALKKGNFYVSQQDKWGLRLDEYYVTSGKHTALCGQEIGREGTVFIHMNISATDAGAHGIKVSVIRNGKVDRVLEAATPVELVYEDSAPAAEKVYYRIFAESGFQALATNPVFAR